MSNIALHRNLHWQRLGWQFDEIMQLRRQLSDLDPFLNAGTYELQQEIGGDLDATVMDDAALQQMPYLVIDDDEFNGDLEFLRQCTELRDLFIFGISASGKITDMQPLAGLTKLRYLSLKYHEIQDVSPLSQLSQLKELYLSENPIGNIRPLIGMKSLEKVMLPEASEEEVFELLRLAPNCSVDYISLEHDEGFNAVWVDDWAYQTRYHKDYQELTIELIPLLHEQYDRDLSEKATVLKHHLEGRARSILRTNENLIMSEFKFSYKTLRGTFSYARHSNSPNSKF